MNQVKPAQTDLTQPETNLIKLTQGEPKSSWLNSTQDDTNQVNSARPRGNKADLVESMQFNMKQAKPDFT